MAIDSVKNCIIEFTLQQLKMAAILICPASTTGPKIMKVINIGRDKGRILKNIKNKGIYLFKRIYLFILTTLVIRALQI